MKLFWKIVPYICLHFFYNYVHCHQKSPKYYAKISWDRLKQRKKQTILGTVVSLAKSTAWYAFISKTLVFFSIIFSPPLFQLPWSNSIHVYFFAIYLRQRYLINGHILTLNKSTFLYTKTSQLLNEPITYLFPFNSNVLHLSSTKIFLVFLKFQEEFHFPFSLISTKVSK